MSAEEVPDYGSEEVERVTGTRKISVRKLPPPLSEHEAVQKVRGTPSEPFAAIVLAAAERTDEFERGRRLEQAVWRDLLEDRMNGLDARQNKFESEQLEFKAMVVGTTQDIAELVRKMGEKTDFQFNELKKEIGEINTRLGRVEQQNNLAIEASRSAQTGVSDLTARVVTVERRQDDFHTRLSSLEDIKGRLERIEAAVNKNNGE